MLKKRLSLVELGRVIEYYLNQTTGKVFRSVLNIRLVIQQNSLKFLKFVKAGNHVDKLLEPSDSS